MPKKLRSILTQLAHFVCLGVLFSCQGKSSSSSSSLRIQFPSASQLANSSQSKSQGLSALSTASSSYDFAKVCFSANITGSGIPVSQNGTCNIDMGIYSGFVALGGSVSLNIPQGSSRKLEIFSYMRSSPSDPCPTTTKGIQGLDLSKIVRVGQVQSFDVTGPQVTVNVDVYAPANGVNVLTQYSLPAACFPKPLPPGSANILAGRGTISGGNFIIVGSMSGQKNEALLQSGQYKVRLSRRVQ